MSRTYDIACMDCKKTLWIAQASQANFYIYSDEKAIKKLTNFLQKHMGHTLKFELDQTEEFEGFQEERGGD